MAIDSECNCRKCRDLCFGHPGWPTPGEARAMIRAGYGPRLRIGIFEADDDDDRFTGIVYALAPGHRDYGGDWHASLVRIRRHGRSGVGCTFHRGGCQLHGTPAKPQECRLSFACTRRFTDRRGYQLRSDVAALWDTKHSRRLIGAWRRRFAIVRGDGFVMVPDGSGG